MRRYGVIEPAFWDEAAAWTDTARVLGLYLRTSRHTTMLGCFRLPLAYVCADLGWQEDRVTQGLEDLRAKGFATYDRDTGWVVVHDFLVHEPIQNPSMAKAITKLLADVPANSAVLQLVMSALAKNGRYLPNAASTPSGHGSDTVSAPSGHGLETSVTPSPHPHGSGSASASGDLDLEGSVREIQRVHPRYESGQANEAAIIEAIAEIARADSMTKGAATEYLLTRTKLYADCTSMWPDKTKITSSTRWFTAGHYRQDPSVWKQANGAERVSKPGPVDYSDPVLKRKLARAAQQQTDGGSQ